MSQKRKLLILSLFVCLSISCIFGTKSKAEDTSGEQTSSISGMEDENTQRLEEVTCMDEEGNIYQMDDSEGTVEGSEKAMYYRSASLKVVNFRTKGNATTSYTEAGTGISGYTNGAYGADAAYLGMSGDKVRFMLAGVVGEVSADEVQVINLTDAKSVSYYMVSNGRLIHHIAQNLSSSSTGSALDNGPAPAYLSGGTTYYSYDGHYFYTDYGTMLSDYQNNTRSQSVNADNPYYNYYQYLPMRSRTGYSDSELNSIVNNRTSAGSKMKDTGTQFVSSQNTYGVNALLMAGIAANESGWGNSNIVQTKNNLFGLNAVDSSPGTSASTYASIDECIRQFANAWMSRQYLNPSNWKYKGAFLGNKASGINVSYASDPYWGEKAAAIAWKLDGDGGSRDNGAYTIAIKDTISTNHNSVNVRSDSTTASAAMYKTGGHSSYSVLVLDSNPVNNFYRIQSDAVLDSGRTGIASGVGEYNFDSMYAYISADYVTIVNQGKSVPVQKVLQSIAIGTPPSKTVYTEGESFESSGMTVTAQWSDGTQTDVTQKVSYSTDALTFGTASVTVSYTADGVTAAAEQAIQVVRQEAEEVPPVEAKDEATGIKVSGAIPEGTKLEVEAINSDHEQYTALISDERVKNHTILGVFDIKLDSELSEGISVELSFPVDEAYNGQKIIIIHYSEVDGKPVTEVYTPEVTDGVAAITVTGFSPYVVALDDAAPPENEGGGTTPPPNGNDGGTTPPPNGNDGGITPPPNGNGGETTVPPNGNGGENTIVPNNENSGEQATTPQGSNGGSNTLTSGETGGKSTGENAGEKAKESTGKTEEIATKEQSIQKAASSKDAKTGNGKEQKKAPKTGDANAVVIWVLLMAASAIALLSAGYSKLRKFHR